MCKYMIMHTVAGGHTLLNKVNNAIDLKLTDSLIGIAQGLYVSRNSNLYLICCVHIY